MNKQRFIDYLRSPERLTDGQFTELQRLLVDYPYFSVAKSIAARAAKDLENPSKGKLIASAAIYATDRKHLKKFINGELVFLTDKPIVASDTEVNLDERKESPSATIDLKEHSKTKATHTTNDVSNSLHVPDEEEVDQIIDELHRDMDELKKARMHFVEIQNQLDTNATLAPRKVEEPSTEESSFTEPDDKSLHIETPPPIASKAAIVKNEIAEELVKSKPTKDAPIKFDLDALKRELAREVDEKEKDQLPPKQVTPKIEEKSTTPPKEKEKPNRPLRARRKEEEDDDDEDMKEPPPVVNVPGSITNMSPAEENDDDEEAELSLPRRKSPRKPRAAVKIKREDLDKIIGKKASGSPAKAEEAPEKPRQEKVRTVSEVKQNEEKPSAPVETKQSIADVPVVSEVDTQMPVEISISNREEEITATENPDRKVTASETEQETKLIPSIEAAPSREEEPARNSIKAFLDLGISVERTSVSRASSSRSKRSARANRTRPSNEGTGDGKGDDESGGQGSLIDKFIEENPSIQRRTVENKDDLSADSGKWNPELASEYLAKIYLDQGNTKRAIQIYETLSLKFPEKKSYFAGLIEKLKK